MRTVLSVLILGLTAVAVHAGEDPLVLRPTDDTYLRPSHAGRPGGIGERDEFQVYGSADKKKQFRALLKFDLKDVKTPPREAILRVYVWNMGSPKKTEAIRCHPLLRDWDEKNASWDQSLADDLWMNTGGDFDATPVSGCNVAPAMGGEKGWWLDFDVTPLVQEWVQKRKPNYGVALLLGDDCTSEVRLRSKEAGGDKAPKLELAWTAKLDRGAGMVQGGKLGPYGDPVKMEPVFAAGGLNMVKAGADFKQVLKARGGAKPYKWTATGLPEGITLNAESGELSGKVAKAGRWSISITCAGADGKKTTQRFEMVAQEGGGAEVAAGDGEKSKAPPKPEKKTGALQDE